MTTPARDLRAYLPWAAFAARELAAQLAGLVTVAGAAWELDGDGRPWLRRAPMEGPAAVAAELELRDRLDGLQRAVALTAAVVASDATELEGSTPTGPPPEGPPNPSRS